MGNGCCPCIFNVEPQIRRDLITSMSVKSKDQSDSSIKNAYGKNTLVQQKKLLLTKGKDKAQKEYIYMEDFEEGDGDPVEQIKPAFNPFKRAAGIVLFQRFFSKGDEGEVPEAQRGGKAPIIPGQHEVAGHLGVDVH